MCNSLICGRSYQKEVTSDFFAAIYDEGRDPRREMLTLDVLSPLMLVLLCSPQQLLDVLGDLLGFTDDIFCAGQTGVRLRLVIIQLGYRAALSQPAAAAQTTSTAKAAGTEEDIYSKWNQGVRDE